MARLVVAEPTMSHLLHEEPDQEGSDCRRSNKSPHLLAVPTFLAGSDDQAVKESPSTLTPRRKAKMSVSINNDVLPGTTCIDELLANDDDVHPHERRAECYKLCTYDEAPPYLQHNPFIRTGYRVNFSVGLCIHSLFRLHNGIPPPIQFRDFLC
jgi:hypothetical protein